MSNHWIKATVFKGDQTGRTIGFPTVNLDPTRIANQKEGVWACVVKHNNKEYAGSLFYGPRLIKNETHAVLEIYIIDFDKVMYGKLIEFKLITWIRGVLDFPTLESLKEQIRRDIDETKKAIKINL